MCRLFCAQLTKAFVAKHPSISCQLILLNNAHTPFTYICHVTMAKAGMAVVLPDNYCMECCIVTILSCKHLSLKAKGVWSCFHVR